MSLDAVGNDTRTSGDAQRRRFERRLDDHAEHRWRSRNCRNLCRLRRMMNIFVMTNTALPAGFNTYFENYDVAASSNAAAVEFFSQIYGPPCCWVYDFNGYGIATLTPAGANTLYAGDTSDPFNVPSVAPTNPPGMTIAHGMSNNLTTEEFESYDDLAMDSAGKIYYSSSFTTGSDTTNCPGNSESSGLLGVLDPSTGAVTQYPTKGVPGLIKIDSSGNAWTILSAG